MRDFEEIRQEVTKTLTTPPFDSSARLHETISSEVVGYRWDEPLIIQIWEKYSGGFFACSPRKELRELLSPGNSPEEALNGFLMRFRLERAMWGDQKQA